jgi:sulfur relay (sulfurtransferase) complex TusBCD TusD component (DsrE family)
MNHSLLIVFIFINLFLILYFKRKNSEKEKEHLYRVFCIQDQLISEKNIKDKMNDSINNLAELEENTQQQLTAIQLKLEFLHLFSKTNL